MNKDRKTILATSLAIGIAIIAVGAIMYGSRDPAEGLYREAADLMMKGRPSEARPLLALIIRDHPKSEFAVRAREVLGEAPVVSSASPAETLFREARNFYPGGSLSRYDLEQASIRYLAVVDSFPGDAVAPAALYEAAQCFDALGDHEETVKLWERFIRDYPADGRTPEALYALGHIHYTQLGMREQGRKRFLELINRFPDTSSAEEARKVLGMKTIDKETITAPEAQEPEITGPPSVQTEGGGV